MIIKAVLFDLDGTLIESRNGFLDTLNACLKKFGLPPLKDVKFDMPVKDIIKSYKGRFCEAKSDSPSPNRHSTDNKIDKKVEELLECYRVVYNEFWKETSVMEGAHEILDGLKRNGLKNRRCHGSEDSNGLC